MSTIATTTKNATIVDTAIAAGSFSTLLTAVKAAGLADTLKGSGPFTVFAPTDSAFNNLPSGTVETLLKPENKEKLKAILCYHVAAGRLGAAEVVAVDSVKTLNGKSINVSVQGSEVRVNQAKVTQADISCENGVIHVIDAVILPE